jgi:hypothetical protein
MSMSMRTIVVRTVAGGLCVVGAGALVMPKTLAAVFGMPTEDATALAYLRATAARDAIIGGILLTTADDPRALRPVLLWSAAIGLVDSVLLAAARGPRPSHALHLGGFVGVALLALTLLGDE